MYKKHSSGDGENSRRCSPGLKRSIERWYPLALAAIATGLTLWKWPHLYTTLDASGVFQTAITVSAITVGFLATAKSVLISGRGRILKAMRKQGTLATFVSYLTSASKAAFASVALSGICVVINWQQADCRHTALFSAWTFVGVLTAALSWRAIHVFCVYLECEAAGPAQ